jgi:hypothetical protein
MMQHSIAQHGSPQHSITQHTTQQQSIAHTRKNKQYHRKKERKKKNEKRKKRKQKTKNKKQKETQHPSIQKTKTKRCSYTTQHSMPVPKNDARHVFIFPAPLAVHPSTSPTDEHAPSFLSQSLRKSHASKFCVSALQFVLPAEGGVYEHVSSAAFHVHRNTSACTDHHNHKQNTPYHRPTIPSYTHSITQTWHVASHPTHATWRDSPMPC